MTKLEERIKYYESRIEFFTECLSGKLSDEERAVYEGKMGCYKTILADLQSITSSHREEIEANELTPYGVAKFWYLKGFKDAETTERQPVPIEQTMKDAEAHFALVWDHKSASDYYEKTYKK